jgi:hypothetical protein
MSGNPASGPPNTTAYETKQSRQAFGTIVGHAPVVQQIRNPSKSPLRTWAKKYLHQVWDRVKTQPSPVITEQEKCKDTPLRLHSAVKLVKRMNSNIKKLIPSSKLLASFGEIKESLPCPRMTIAWSTTSKHVVCEKTL